MSNLLVMFVYFGQVGRNVGEARKSANFVSSAQLIQNRRKAPVRGQGHRAYYLLPRLGACLAPPAHSSYFVHMSPWRVLQRRLVDCWVDFAVKIVVKTAVKIVVNFK